MTREAYLNYCAGLPGAVVDQPFPEDFQSWVARHWDSRKWFALVMKVDGRDAVNLKCSPMEADLLRSAYTGVRPGYHMNKTHWNTVYLESDVPEEELLRKERTQRLLLAVRRMSEIDCSLFYRKYYYLQSAAQMAAELGLTERGVEGRLRRIRLRLRKELRGEWNV